VITTDSRADLLAFARARLADEPSAAAAGTLREVLRLYESATRSGTTAGPRTRALVRPARRRCCPDPVAGRVAPPTSDGRRSTAGRGRAPLQYGDRVDR
jgi:hypothetical protein